MDNRSVASYGLGEEIVKALKSIGFETLTEVQQQAIPLILHDKDIIVKSQTGSGKTAAFAIPLCEKMEIEQKNPQVLVLTPTRELAVQIKQDIANIGRFKKIRCAAVYGKHPIEFQKRELKQRVHAIVGTPGRTYDHIERKNFILDEIRYLVIDEADKMLDMGFIEQIEAIIKMLPPNRVTLLFSATMPEKIVAICDKYMRNPEKIEVKSENPTTDKIDQYFYEVDEENKSSLLNNIFYIQRPESCIVFCNTREQVDAVFSKMKHNGYLCSSLHGGMEQRERLMTIQKFKRGEFRFLIATDVVARGIHIDDIALIINYDVPMESESYVHRIGRTGRAGNEGTALTFVTPRDHRFLTEIEEYVQYKIPKRELPTLEEVESGKRIFEKSRNVKPKRKQDVSEYLNKGITRVRINAGKKTKMRPGDIMGALTSISGVDAGDVGIIDVQDTCSYVEILGGKGELVLDALPTTKIKGKLQSIREVGHPSL
ncbi:DEAD/DEAH box helicase [Heliobacillus mobilis]|uniref:ATP-dependent RNA helicase DbpA n=1 Tax=Heliobacterium mobile TaxID=28064 RepID=A0A6I3SNN6_HELMO|nr:DEAD/DEAH box helicase [Heliobacterium mobile]MTV50631.1 DEAD/DEAH box helicase [Heliobacterium mobile]